MQPLQKIIDFWEMSVELQGYLISPAMQVIIQDTIAHLKELKQLKGEE